MRRFPIRWLACGLIMLACLALSTGHRPEAAQAQSLNIGIGAGAGALLGQPKGAETKRLVYALKYRSAKDLAEVVSKHFKNEAEVQVLAEPGSNCLLINVPSAALAEMVKL